MQSRIYIICLVLLVSFRALSQESECILPIGDPLRDYVRLDHVSREGSVYMVNFSAIPDDSRRQMFLHLAGMEGIFIYDKTQVNEDSAFFIRSDNHTEATYEIFRRIFSELKSPSAPLADVVDCSTAQVACSGNIYTFPSGTNATSAPPAVNNYPNYGCLGSMPGPAWYYMWVSQPGDIIISIEQYDAGGTFRDVDFICWGPFQSVSAGCDSGLTGRCDIPGYPNCCNNTSSACNIYPSGNMVDCSYDAAARETCHILNAQVGEFYILLLTNFWGQPAFISFSQSAGDGVTDCNIVYHCSIVAITTNTSACDPLTNTFSISGVVEFTNPPPSGVLTISDITANPRVSQILNPPFVSPKAYTLTSIPCDGLEHVITAQFSDSVLCTISRNVTVPPPSCPSALISGGGSVCANGTATAPLSIQLDGMGPFDFTYAVNGVPQTPVTNYNGPSPYTFNTTTAGIYTLLSVSNSVCPGPGNISGSAVVNLLPEPVPVIAGPQDVCLNNSIKIYQTQSGNTNYQWTVSPGGTIVAGSGTNAVTVVWNSSGNQSISVNYQNSLGCMAVNPPVMNVLVHPRPVPVITGPLSSCMGTAGNIFQTDPSKTGYVWTISSGGTIVSGQGTNTVTVNWNVMGNQTVSVVYEDPPGCSPLAPTDLNVTVNPVPVVRVRPCFDTLTTTNARPFTLRGAIPSGGTWSGTGITATDYFSPWLSGAAVRTITYTCTNSFSCTSSSSIRIHVLAPAGFFCGNIFTDIRDNKKYPTVQIGSLCWMAANLNYGTTIASAVPQFDNCINEKYCTGDNPLNCNSQGGFYQWDEMMRYEDTPVTQGICPPSWHIPREAEWNNLFANYTNIAFAASFLKSSGFSGFDVLMTGVYHQNLNQVHYGNFGTFFWTSEKNGPFKAWAHGMNNPDPSVSTYSASRSDAFLVRCVKD